MDLKNETFTYILKQYLKGKKDNMYFILITLRKFIIEKYEKYNLKPDEIKVLIKFVIHGIDTYSFEKTILFEEYINLYVDISFNEYMKEKELQNIELPNDEFYEIYINNLNLLAQDNKTKNLNLN